MTDDARIIEGDCLEVLQTLEAGSVDAVITDPPYPCIDRPYGRWTEGEWWDLMMSVCREVRRILKPSGSAVFILQPNSRKVGSMRGWLFRFQAWVCDHWNMVQDAWWWDFATMPSAVSIQGRLLRSSLKACVWVGSANCYRDQDSVLWSESACNKAERLHTRMNPERQVKPSGHSDRETRSRTACLERGGVLPFNVLPVPTGRDRESAKGHPASTPMNLARWWVRYICPPGGTVLDPFLGSGTMALAALREGRSCIGIERVPEYVEIARNRLANELARFPLFAAGGEP